MAMDWFVCGNPVSGTSDSLVLPITADVPRSDPALGATILLIYFQVSDFETALITGAVDTAAATDAYSFCLFADGLNHYSSTITEPMAGLIANDLAAGTDSILISLNSAPADFLVAAAIALTGVKLLAFGGAPLFADPTLPSFLANFIFDAVAPVVSPTTHSSGIAATIDGGGTITFADPTAATDEGWAWSDGEIAFYTANPPDETTDHLGWTWSDPTIDDFLQWDIDTGAGRAQTAIGVGTVIPSAAGPSVAGAWGDSSLEANIGALALGVSGEGPGPCSSPPPTSGPSFNRVIPLCETSRPPARSSNRFSRNASGFYLPIAA